MSERPGGLESVPVDGDAWCFGAAGGDFGHDTTPPRITLLDAVLPKLRDELERGEPPIQWTPAPEPWGSLSFRPHTVMVIGSPPATGKTSLVLNVVTRMQMRYPDLRVLVASNEMRTAVMMERILSMHSGVEYRLLRNRDRSRYTKEDIERASQVLGQVGPRLAFLERPFTVEQLHDAAREHRADIVFVDFLQASGTTGFGGDVQQGVASVMRTLRALADSGPCVITTAAMSRQGIAHSRDRVGRVDVNERDMGVFLHASEIEHEADTAYLLLAESGAKVAVSPDEPYEPICMWLQCVKARDEARVHVPLWFDGRFQTFTLRDASKPSGSSARESKAVSRPRSAGRVGAAAKAAIPTEEKSNDPWLT
jgi:archaellum biogenesis ATPase FlaH